jgi:hypothetical protein
VGPYEGGNAETEGDDRDERHHLDDERRPGLRPSTRPRGSQAPPAHDMREAAHVGDTNSWPILETAAGRPRET